MGWGGADVDVDKGVLLEIRWRPGEANTNTGSLRGWGEGRGVVGGGGRRVPGRDMCLHMHASHAHLLRF